MCISTITPFICVDYLRAQQPATASKERKMKIHCGKSNYTSFLKTETKPKKNKAIVIELIKQTSERIVCVPNNLQSDSTKYEIYLANK